MAARKWCAHEQAHDQRYRRRKSGERLARARAQNLRTNARGNVSIAQGRTWLRQFPREYRARVYGLRRRLNRDTLSAHRKMRCNRVTRNRATTRNENHQKETACTFKRRLTRSRVFSAPQASKTRATTSR